MTDEHTDDVLLETDLDDGNREDDVDEELEERVKRAIENAESVGEETEEAERDGQ